MTGNCSKHSSDLCLGTMYFFATQTWTLVKLLRHSTEMGLFNRLDDITCLTPEHPQQCFLSRPSTNLPIKLLNSLSQHVSGDIKCSSKIKSSTNKPLLSRILEICLYFSFMSGTAKKKNCNSAFRHFIALFIAQ